MSEKDGGPAMNIYAPVFKAHGRYTDAVVAKFVGKIERQGGLRGCWMWTGAKSAKGYGIFSISKREQARAHRVALELFRQSAPSNYVLHLCDNPGCVNPLHLQEGTHGDNMKQMADRKRATRHERHHKAKLSFHEAVAVSVLHRSGEYTTAELATMFGVSKATAISVASGKLWRDAYAIADAMLKAREVKPHE